jgi:acyl-CoA synthetase (AMP-forming)/AMP-acid ligase II
LLAFTAERVARYKVPCSLDTDQPPRNDAGKINRSLLRAVRRRAIGS